MRRPSLNLPAPAIAWPRGAAPLAAGLAMLIVVAAWPWLPGVTAMALVALGATEVTLKRVRGRGAELPLVLLHACTYVALYALFVGAALHGLDAPTSAPPFAAWPWLAVADLAISTWPLAIVLRRTCAVIGPASAAD